MGFLGSQENRMPKSPMVVPEGPEGPELSLSNGALLGIYADVCLEKPSKSDKTAQH